MTTNTDPLDDTVRVVYVVEYTSRDKMEHTEAYDELGKASLRLYELVLDGVCSVVVLSDHTRVVV